MSYTVTATVEIAATPKRVWAVLADLPSYPQWHPVYLAVTGQLTAGSTLTITTTHPRTGRTMTAKVKVLTAEPGTELRWASKLLGLTISDRRFLLSPDAGGTSLVWTRPTGDSAAAAAAARSGSSAASRTPSRRSTRPLRSGPRVPGTNEGTP